MAHNQVVIVLQNNEVVARTVLNQVVVASPGPQGPIGLTGPAGADGVDGAPGGTRYEFVQASPSSVWVMTHNLGYHPHITILVGDEVVDTDVVHNSINQATSTAASPIAGKGLMS